MAPAISMHLDPHKTGVDPARGSYNQLMTLGSPSLVKAVLHSQVAQPLPWPLLRFCLPKQSNLGEAGGYSGYGCTISFTLHP